MLPEAVVRPRKLVIEDEIIIIVNIVFNLKEREILWKKDFISKNLEAQLHILLE